MCVVRGYTATRAGGAGGGESMPTPGVGGVSCRTCEGRVGGHACAVARAGEGMPTMLCVQGRGGVHRRTAGEGTPALLCVQGRGGAPLCVCVCSAVQCSAVQCSVV